MYKWYGNGELPKINGVDSGRKVLGCPNKKVLPFGQHL